MAFKTKEQIQFLKDLDELLNSTYSKAQAYFRKEHYGASEDEDQEWDSCYEKEYKKMKRDFIMKYQPVGEAE